MCFILKINYNKHPLFNFLLVLVNKFNQKNRHWMRCLLQRPLNLNTGNIHIIQATQ